MEDTTYVRPSRDEALSLVGDRADREAERRQHEGEFADLGQQHAGQEGPRPALAEQPYDPDVERRLEHGDEGEDHQDGPDVFPDVAHVDQ